MALQKLVPEFERAEGVKVRIEILNYDDLYKRIDQQILSRAATYDVAMIDCILVPNYVVKGALTPIDQAVFQDSDYDYSDLIPALADYLGRYPADGTLYGVPFMSNTHMMAFRPKVVEPVVRQLGLNLPGTTSETAWTWNDYLRVSRVITSRGNGKTFGTSLQARPGAWIVYEWYSELFGFEPSAEARKTGLPDFSAAGVQAAQYYADLYKAAPKEALTWGHEEETAAMCSGLTAMDATSNVELAANLTKRECDKDMGPLQFGFPPKSTAGTSSPDMGGYGLYVMASSSNKLEAERFLRWATTKNIHLAVVENGGSPVRTSELSNLAVLQNYPYLKFYGDLIAASVYRARIPQWPELQDVISRNLADVMTGQTPAKAAMGAVETWAKQNLDVSANFDAPAH